MSPRPRLAPTFLRCHGKALTLADASLGRSFFPFQRWEEMTTFKLRLLPPMEEEPQTATRISNLNLRIQVWILGGGNSHKHFGWNFHPYEKFGVQKILNMIFDLRIYFSIGLVRFNHQVDWNVTPSDDFWWHLKVRSSFDRENILKASKRWWWSVPTGLHGVVAKEHFALKVLGVGVWFTTLAFTYR